MPEPWDSLSPEAQAELRGYADFAGNNAREFGSAAAGMASDAWAGAGNAWQHILTARPLPHPVTSATMETTTHTSEPLGKPESTRSALLKYGVAEGAEREADHHWRSYAQTEAAAATQDNTTSFYGVGAPTNEAAPAASGSATSSGIGAPERWEAFNQSAHATPEVDSSAPTYGVGAPESWQGFNNAAHAEPGSPNFYGVGPPAQDTQTQDTAQLQQDSYGPEP